MTLHASTCSRGQRQAKMSVVWKFLKVSETNVKTAICNDCSSSVMQGGVSTKSFNTTNLILHCNNRHPNRYDEFMAVKKEKEKQQVTSGGDKKTHQQTLLQSLTKQKKYNRDHIRAKGIIQKLMECIALDNQLFSFVEDAGFRRFLDYVEPRYMVPSRRCFSDIALPELQAIIFSNIEKLIAYSMWLSFTTDI